MLKKSLSQNPHWVVDNPVQRGVCPLCRLLAALWVTLPAALHQGSAREASDTKVNSKSTADIPSSWMGTEDADCWNTWEKGSSSPTLWFWKHTRHHGLQILPECRETSRPSSENYWQRDFIEMYKCHFNAMSQSWFFHWAKCNGACILLQFLNDENHRIFCFTSALTCHLYVTQPKKKHQHTCRENQPVQSDNSEPLSPPEIGWQM